MAKDAGGDPLMTRLPNWIALLATVALLLASTPVRADFYSLEGRYECLAVPDAVCYDATPSPAPPEPPVPRHESQTVTDRTAVDKAEAAAPATEPQKDRKGAAAKPPEQPPPGISISTHICCRAGLIC